MRNLRMVQTDFSSRPASEDLRARLRISSCITLIVTSGDLVRTFSCGSKQPAQVNARGNQLQKTQMFYATS